MVYTAEHPALAALEILTGWEVYATLSGYFLYRCTFGAEHVLGAPAELDVRDREVTRVYGDAWVQSCESVVLKVRSLAIPGAYNYLLNPNHPDFAARVKLKPLGAFAFNARTKKLVRKAH